MQRKKERKKNVVLEKKFVVAYPVDKMAKKRLFLLTNLLTKFYWFLFLPTYYSTVTDIYWFFLS